MKIISLKLVVEKSGIDTVEVHSRDEDNQPVKHSFEVPSEEYEEKKIWLIKGEYHIGVDHINNKRILEIHHEDGRLEKELNITIPKATVVTDGGETDPDAEAKIEAMMNLPVTVVVFHRELLISSARETQKKFSGSYADVVVESYKKQNPDAQRKDFAVFEIDFANRQVSLKSLYEEAKIKSE